MLKNQFVKYAIINGATTFLYIVLFNVAIACCEVSYLWVNMAAYSVSLFVAYLLTKYFVFENREKSKNTAIPFLITRGIMLGLSSLFMYIIVDIFHLHKSISQIIVTGGLFLLSYVINKMIFTKR